MSAHHCLSFHFFTSSRCLTTLRKSLHPVLQGRFCLCLILKRHCLPVLQLAHICSELLGENDRLRSTFCFSSTNGSVRMSCMYMPWIRRMAATFRRAASLSPDEQKQARGPRVGEVDWSTSIKSNIIIVKERARRPEQVVQDSDNCHRVSPHGRSASVVLCAAVHTAKRTPSLAAPVTGSSDARRRT